MTEIERTEKDKNTENHQDRLRGKLSFLSC